MNDFNQEILTELRKLRRTNQWVSIAALIMLITVAIVAVFVFVRMPRPVKSRWTEVTNAMRQSDYSKALTLAQAIAAQQPSDYYGHEYLGSIYLAMGDSAHAEAEYARAYELYPDDEIQKHLDAVRKRREREAKAPVNPAAKP